MKKKSQKTKMPDFRQFYQSDTRTKFHPQMFIKRYLAVLRVVFV